MDKHAKISIELDKPYRAGNKLYGKGQRMDIDCPLHARRLQDARVGRIVPNEAKKPATATAAPIAKDSKS